MLGSFSTWIYEQSRNYLNIKISIINCDTIKNTENAECSVSAWIIVTRMSGSSDTVSPFGVSRAGKQVLREPESSGDPPLPRGRGGLRGRGLRH